MPPSIKRPSGGRVSRRHGGPLHLSPAFRRRLQGLLPGHAEPSRITRRTVLVTGLGAAAGTRLRGRRGAAIATVSVAHSILVAVFHILDRLVAYPGFGYDGLFAATRLSATPPSW